MGALRDRMEKSARSTIATIWLMRASWTSWLAKVTFGSHMSSRIGTLHGAPFFQLVGEVAHAHDGVWHIDVDFDPPVLKDVKNTRTQTFFKVYET